MVYSLNSAWDLSVVDRNGQLVLVVEVKIKLNASPQWAAQFRSNILAHGTFPNAPYTLIVFPDKFYLWTDVKGYLNQSEPIDRKPDYIIDARPILQPYFDKTKVRADRIGGLNLELIVLGWLSEIIYSGKSAETLDKSLEWLIDSGLYAALAGGQIKHEEVA